MKAGRRKEYIDKLSNVFKNRFKDYLSKGEPLEHRRMAMNLLWTGDT